MPRSDSVSRAVAARRPAGLVRTSGLGTRPSSSVETAPAASPSRPEASTNGRSESARAALMASTRPPVGSGGCGEIAPEGHLVLEGQVDHTVRVGRRLGQTVGVVEVTVLNDDAGGLQALRGCLGAGQADHLVAGAERLRRLPSRSSPTHR